MAIFWRAQVLMPLKGMKDHAKAFLVEKDTRKQNYYYGSDCGRPNSSIQKVVRAPGIAEDPKTSI